ncbi:MAG: EAL domain-containing protein [Atribacterota bacterium]
MVTVVMLFVFYSALSVAVYLSSHFHKRVEIHLAHTICVLLAVWSLGLALVRIAPSYEKALFWQRISATGWTTIYSVFLHLSLILSSAHLSRKWWVLVLTYFPASLSLFAFSILPGVAQRVQHLALMHSTWVVLPVADFWNRFFELYCTTSVGISSFLIFRMGWKLNHSKEKKSTTFFIFSLLCAMTLGMIFDRFSMPRRFPELSNLAPVMALFPLTVFAQTIRNSQNFWILRKKRWRQQVTQGEILSEADKASLYQFLAGIHILTGFGYATLAVLAQRPAVTNRVLWGVLMLFLGMSTSYLTSLEISEKSRDSISGAILALSAFFLWFEITTVLGRVDVFLSLVILPFLFPAILSGNRWALFMGGAVLFLVQTYTWTSLQSEGNHPEAVLTQILVTVLSGLAILATLFIRQVYLRRLEENRKQLQIQELIAGVSSQFIGPQPQNVKENLQSALCIIATQLNMPWGFLEVSSEEGSVLRRIHLEDGPLWVEPDELTFLRAQTENGTPLWLDSAHLSPLEERHLGQLFAREMLRAIVAIPLQNKDVRCGLLVLGTRDKVAWSKYGQESLRILGNVLVEALARMKAEKRLEHMALYDSLTELPNRVLFLDRLTKAMQRAKRTGKLVAVAFLDIDSFKLINDSEGHEVGDQLLKQVAQRFSSCIREHDTIARFGGDEFLIVFDNLNQFNEIPPMVERITEEIQKPFFIGNQEFLITASCGIALYPGDGESPEELIQAADLAMYAAKATGEGRYAFCSPHLKAEVQQKQTLTSGLYKAIEREELTIYYQPQVEVTTGSIVGLEALLRWNHPELGLLLPGSFIPLAEQKGLIIPIGEWVLKKACSQITSWQKKGVSIPRLGVNLSPVQLRDPQLVQKVHRTLSETALPPEILELEVTESAIFHNPDEAIALLQNLKNLGVRIALDDFGVGYSSLIRLKMLPVDRIKLDRRFFHNAPYNLRDRTIAESIIQLARSIDAAVIAEGVETETQLQFVTEQGCYEVQGFYYYHPLPPEEIEALLLKGVKH